MRLYKTVFLNFRHTHLAPSGFVCISSIWLTFSTRVVQVHRQPYPIPAEAGAAVMAGSAPPLRITYALPKHVIVPAEQRQVGWFDEVWSVAAYTNSLTRK